MCAQRKDPSKEFPPRRPDGAFPCAAERTEPPFLPADPVCRRLPLPAIHPEGLLAGLLARQRTGLSGALPAVFPEVGPSSAWLGGDGEAWERGPYYLDGLIPLAFLTDDAILRERVETWVRAILSSQRADGWFGPARNDDWWPRFVAAKALLQYHEATGSPAVLAFLSRFCDHMAAQLPHRPPAFWGYVRVLEVFPVVEAVRRATNPDRGGRLLETLFAASFPWSAYFIAFPYPAPTTAYLNRRLFRVARPFLMALDELAKRRRRPCPAPDAAAIRKANARPANAVYLLTHGVNLAMAVKYPVYERLAQGETTAAPGLAALAVLTRHHGTAAGAFSSDEHLDGTSPAQGIELCAVVELMHSLEEILVLTGSVAAADKLESLAWNTLPATFTADLCAHQYCQQTDQHEASVRRHPFFDAGRRATTFGVAPNYGCCAANMHQGFPKFAATAFLQKGDGVVLMLFVAGTYEAEFATGTAVVRVETGYPFADGVLLHVLSCSAAGCALDVRRPFGTEVRVDGASRPDADGLVRLTAAMQPGDTFAVSFAFPIETVANSDGTTSVRRGPLLFVQRFAAEERRLGGRPPFHDRSFLPLEPPRPATLLVRRGEAVVLGYRAGPVDPDFYHNHHGPDVAAVDADGNHRVLSLFPYATAPLRHTHFQTQEDA